MKDERKQDEKGNRWPSPREWGRKHGFPDGMVYRGIQEGTIPHIKVGKRLFVHPDALEMMVQGGKLE